ncbi:hypothetical protein Nepgr_003608 [Nepenthes gracilis]|uniref:Uncharacterized protein n=1 Tax=Nepenthes gracilis TaxID=150966 RepID=A0AAD3XDV5_NEPGR|nr:hypothetical protein Nepgr_003608 [Nepenthes gracilis]
MICINTRNDLQFLEYILSHNLVFRNIFNHPIFTILGHLPKLDIGDVLEGPWLQTGGVGWPGYTGFVYLSRSWFCPGRVFEGAAHIPLCLDALIFYSPLEGTLCVTWRTRVQNSVSGF